MRWMRLVTVLGLLGALVAGPATAGIYTITLKNGTVFESRYRPVEADYDSSKLIFLSDQGNHLALSKSEVESIVSEIEGSGFGTVIDTTTIAFGWDPGLSEEETDVLLNEEADGMETAAGGSGNTQTDAMVKAFQDFGRTMEESRQVPDYNVEQFVEPDETAGQPIPGAWGNSAGGDEFAGDEIEDF